MRAPYAVTFLTAMSLLAACGDPLTPADLAGTYDLKLENSDTLPRLLSATVECDLFLTGGTLVLNADESFALTLEERLDCSRGGGPMQEAGRAYPGTFTVSGRRITFTSPRLQNPPLTFQGTASGGIVAVAIVDADVSAWGRLDPVFERQR